MFQIYKDQLSPAIHDVIRIDGVPVNLTNATVKFRMRAEMSATLKVDRDATIVDAAGGEVKFANWQTGDTDTAGDFLGWWNVTFPSAEAQDTAEFPIRVLVHAPTSTWLCTLSDVREALEYEADYIERDEVIRTKIEDASALIVNWCYREFVPTSTGVTRRFRVYPRNLTKTGNIRVNFGQAAPYDLNAVTEVKLHPEGTPITLTEGTDFVLEPEGGGKDGVYWAMLLYLSSVSSTTYQRFGYALLDVKGDWGYPTIPRPVRDACVDAVVAWMRRDFTVGGDAMLQEALVPPITQTLWLPRSAQRKLYGYMRMGLGY